MIEPEYLNDNLRATKYVAFHDVNSGGFDLIGLMTST